ncbi:alpha/beta hydrolase [Ruegeria sp. 2205SS24-7]|uniref:alpha/beta fold hydrolase n=1 Tax=Ruegeria discodermiae TaxID=3064389 RepID=UPI002741BB08|nr:alpha/beta hydrolase [Ruegeria sp. 2205SS24-7]MDP5217635.1 alpha/beta hydrolase [Ruegeria sp. 2205SS24-7]
MPSFTTTDGLKLHFSDAGTGVPLLCLPGLTRNGDDFNFVKPHLDRLRLLTLDFRGRGGSDFDPNHMNYNIGREAQDVIELLDHLGLDKVALLGTSRGGLVSMVLAATHPGRLAAVILNDIGPEIASAGLERIMGYVGIAPNSTTLDQAAVGLKKFMDPEFPGVPLERWRAQAAFQYDETKGGLTLRYDAKLRDALLEQAQAGPPPDLWPLFEALKPIPTGVIRGANSDLFTAETLQKMHDGHPGLVSAEVPDRGHVPFLDEPEALDIIHQVLEQI